MIPEVLNRAKVRRLRGQFQDDVSLLCKPLESHLGGVFGVVVLLKDDVLDVEIVCFQCFTQTEVQDVDVWLGIHLAFDFSSVSNSLPSHIAPSHTAPDHYISAAKLDRSGNVMFFQPIFLGIYPLLTRPITTETID